MKLKRVLAKNSGRSGGKIMVRHQGGRRKRFLREIDFKRDKHGVFGKVEAIEYDPNRNAKIALILYKDGERRYILAPYTLKVGDEVVSGENVSVSIGNALPLGKIPVGTQVHNLELAKGKGGQIVKSAGSVAIVFGKEEKWVLIKLPSGEIRRFDPGFWATVGQVGNIEAKNRILGKAGVKRRKGIRPSVRGVAMHPKAHPHGGGEGRSGVGMKYPKTVYGEKAVGRTRAKKKYSDKLIIKGRKK